MKVKGTSLTGNKRKREDEDEIEGEEIFQAAADHPLFWSDPTILSRVCPWLTLLDFGRVEQICRGSTIHDDRWQELIERYYRPGKMPAIGDRFVEKFGGYRGLMRYEVLFVRKNRTSESFVNVPRLLPLNFPRREGPSTSPQDVITTIEVNAFGKRKILSLRKLFAQTKMFGGGSIQYSFEEPLLVLGKASCLKRALGLDVNTRKLFLRSCGCTDPSCSFSNWHKNGGITFRIDLELPGRMCSLQPTISDCFCLDEDVDPNSDGSLVSLHFDNSARPIVRSSAFENWDNIFQKHSANLFFRPSLSAARIQQAFGSALRNTSILCCPFLGLVDKNNVGVTGFSLAMAPFLLGARNRPFVFAIPSSSRSKEVIAYISNLTLLHLFEELEGAPAVPTASS